jgi:hypothetical protein
VDFPNPEYRVALIHSGGSAPKIIVLKIVSSLKILAGTKIQLFKYYLDEKVEGLNWSLKWKVKSSKGYGRWRLEVRGGRLQAESPMLKAKWNSDC